MSRSITSLTGTYPSPSLAAGAVTDCSLSSSAQSVAIAGGTVVEGTSPTVTTSFNRLGGAVTVTRPSTGGHNITIPGTNYYFSQYVAQVAPLDDGNGSISEQTDSVGDNLLLHSYNAARTLTNNSFAFVVYR